jgi:hypothetical protein
MRRGLVVPVVAVLLGWVMTLAGCGQDQTRAEDDKEPTGKVAFHLVEMVTETGAGGTVAAQAVPLADIVAVQEFSKQFENDAMQTRLIRLVKTTGVPDGKALYGAVVAVGCEAPPGVVVNSKDAGLTIEGQPVPSPPKECFAPMTSVALVLVDEDIVG